MLPEVFQIHIDNKIQFSTNIKIKMIKFKPVLLAWAFGPTGLTKLLLNTFYLNICGKLSIK